MTSDKPIKAYRGYSSKAYRTVERYLSPVSGSNATIVFPSFSGSLASSTAAYTAAPEDIPTSNPSFSASSRLVRIASSFVTRRILSTTPPVVGLGDKAGSDALYLVRAGLAPGKYR